MDENLINLAIPTDDGSSLRENIHKAQNYSWSGLNGRYG